ncbi:hypothetical protein Q5752_006276 [Cryptotrichosporon argae]
MDAGHLAQPSAVHPGIDDASVEAWTSFLSDYARGQFSPDEVPAPPTPTAFRPQAASPDYAADCPVYYAVDIDGEAARRVQRFYVRNGFLPPPRAPLEPVRERIILEYDLYSREQVGNIESAVDLVQAVFGGLCTFTLFRDNVQVLMAVCGDPDVVKAVGLAPGNRLLPETSLCGHQILFDRAELHIPNLATDWRYAGNPYCEASAGIKSYYGSTVYLPIDPSEPAGDPRAPLDGPSKHVGVGVINIMHLEAPIVAVTAEQRRVLRHTTRMLETNLRATWEGHMRTKQAKAQRAVYDFIEYRLAAWRSSAAELAGSRRGSEDSQSASAEQAVLASADPLVTGAQDVCERIRSSLSEADLVAIVDTRGFHRVTSAGMPQHVFANTARPARTYGWSCDAPRADFSTPPAIAAIAALLETHGLDSAHEFRDGLSSGLEPFLPPDLRSHVALPFATAGDPLFLVIVASASSTVAAHDITFVRSMGVILHAQIVQSRLVEADAAKTLFLSSISHELRTPMHSLMTGLQLVAESLQEREPEQALALLPTVIASGRTLQQILNDVLDSGGLLHAGRGSGIPKRHATAEADLAAVVIETAKACWATRNSETLPVMLKVEWEERDWRCMISEVGFQRAMLNGLSNAIKNTSAGQITVGLKTLSPTRILLTVSDTGSGVSPDLLPKLFRPFVKGDTFVPGTGLGLFITRNLVEGMGGTISLTSELGKGSELRVELPVAFVETASSACALRQLTIDDTRSPHPLSTALQIPPLSIPPLPDSPVATAPGDFRVLVVDDNDVNRRLLLTVINRLKLPIVTASAADGQAGLDVYKAFRPHFVATDVSMPVMDGIAMAAAIRAHERACGDWPATIYAITGLGHTDPRLRANALRGEAQIDGWLIKGKDTAKAMREIVTTAMASRRAQMDA